MENKTFDHLWEDFKIENPNTAGVLQEQYESFKWFYNRLKGTEASSLRMEKNNITAVEWLVEQLRMQTPLYTKIEMIEMAKEMEKVMNEYSWIAGAKYSILVLKDKTAKGSKESFEEYYNETYNK